MALVGKVDHADRNLFGLALGYELVNVGGHVGLEHPDEVVEAAGLPALDR